MSWASLDFVDVIKQGRNELSASMKTIENQINNIATYNALIKLMTSQRMPDDAVRIHKKMIQNGIEPSIHSYNMIMKSYFQIRNYEMEKKIWQTKRRE